MTQYHPLRRPTVGRRRVATLAVVLVGWAVATPASAQVTFRTIGRETGDVFEDVGYIWGAPFRAERRDWAGAAIAGAVFGASLTVDARIDKWIVDHPRAAPIQVLGPFRDGGPLLRLATAKNLVPIATALVIAGAVSDNRGLREAGFGCLAGWGLSNTLRYAVYAGVSRHRPYVADGDQYLFAVPGGKWDQHSFPAGHAMNAYACASFWSERFELGVGEPALYVVASMASLARLADRRHWTSDTFVGAIIGVASGRMVAARYASRESKRNRVSLPANVTLWRGTF